MNEETSDALLRRILEWTTNGKMSSRSYRRIRDEVYELAASFDREGSARHAIHDLIRRQYGCRVMELREGDLDDVLAFLAGLRPRIFQYREIRWKFEEAAIKQVFGAAGAAALEFAPEEELSKIDPLEMPKPPPIVYGGNVVRFPSRER